MKQLRQLLSQLLMKKMEAFADGDIGELIELTTRIEEVELKIDQAAMA